jgi:hypothetical protein
MISVRIIRRRGILHWIQNSMMEMIRRRRRILNQIQNLTMNCSTMNSPKMARQPRIQTCRRFIVMAIQTCARLRSGSSSI